MEIGTRIVAYKNDMDVLYNIPVESEGTVDKVTKTSTGEIVWVKWDETLCDPEEISDNSTWYYVGSERPNEEWVDDIQMHIHDFNLFEEYCRDSRI